MDPRDRCSAEPVLEPQHEGDYLVWDLDVPYPKQDATAKPMGSMTVRWYEDGKITMSAVGSVIEYMLRKDAARRRNARSD